MHSFAPFSWDPFSKLIVLSKFAENLLIFAEILLDAAEMLLDVAEMLLDFANILAKMCRNFPRIWRGIKIS